MNVVPFGRRYLSFEFVPVPLRLSRFSSSEVGHRHTPLVEYGLGGRGESGSLLTSGLVVELTLEYCPELGLGESFR